ncbi:MAG: right-handed parallel beta-helix repeat-containing protein, partial [Desulfobacteraceae bacterium]|nr:right-handed parallel beta-helix repeat-containing protein [Desulfobacteraceae bacterium]
MRKVICIVGIIALLSAIIVVTPAAATTLDVYPGQSIQSAINSASDGDIILVHAGTYYEGAIRILGAAKRNITLKGEGADKVTLDGGGSSDNIGIGGDSMENGASGCVVEGFKMINSGKGIEIASFAPDCIIRNCVIEAPSMMIILHARNITFMNNVISNSTYSSRALSIPRNGSTIVNNTIINSVGAAILPYYDAPGPNGIISRNNFISNGKGIWLHSSYTYPGNKIYLNNFVNNTINVQYTGTPPLTYWNSTEPIDYTYGSNTYTNYLGNYWSPQYTGSDGDGDGIGDAPYDIPPASPVHYDYRPLMEKFENYVGAPAAAEPPHLATYTISNRTITPPQTTEIDVEFSETVSYKIAIEKGTATIYD